MAKLPPSFNTQVHKYGERLTMNNIKRWTIDQIIEYNEFNHDNAQVQIVKYKCGAIGQKVGTKTHAKKCRNGCDVNDLTIRFMDNENNSWKDEEKYKGFAKYKCGAIGQKVGTKTHAKKCRNGCDVNDLTIRFMDNENNSWKDEEEYKGFAKGAGSKRQRKKQVDPKQRTLDRFWKKPKPKQQIHNNQ
eukprot:633895_1